MVSFIGASSPFDESGNGAYIDNIFIKTKTLNTKTFRLMIPTPDHYPSFIMADKPKYLEPKGTKNFYNY